MALLLLFCSLCYFFFFFLSSFLLRFGIIHDEFMIILLYTSCNRIIRWICLYGVGIETFVVRIGHETEGDLMFLFYG